MKDLLAAMKFNPFGEVTHDTLAALMPFYCCWLDDGEGKPCTASVAIGSAMYTASPLNIKPGNFKGKPWKN